MANDLNRCDFIGRLGGEVETRFQGNGGAIANFTLAVGWKSKEKDGAEWVRVVAFNKLAEIMGQYLKKGSRVYISGSFRTRKWQDKDGQDRYTTEIVANQMQMLDSKRDTSNDHNNAPAMGQQQAPTYSEDMPDFDDSIPFMRLTHEYCR